MTEQKLKKIGARERTAIELAASTNRRARENAAREQARRMGPVACAWCGAEPCGVFWTRPGDPEPGGERCCDQCTHEPVDGWLHTHTAWGGGQPFPVCALVMHEGETVYLRRDGTVQFLEMRAPVPGAQLTDDPEADVPAVSLLGKGLRGACLYVAGEGGDRATDLWENQRQLDPLWLAVRMQAAVARDDARKVRRAAERRARDEAHDRKVAEIIESERIKREADIAKRQLKHEVRLVLDEVPDEATIDDSDADEEAALMPTPAQVEADVQAELDAEAKATKAAKATEPERPVNLKAPAPVKKGPGRPKRSLRQRTARKRQKLAWAKQEAKNRLEVKRLERLARAQGQNLVKEEE